METVRMPLLRNGNGVFFFISVGNEQIARHSFPDFTVKLKPKLLIAGFLLFGNDFQLWLASVIRN